MTCNLRHKRSQLCTALVLITIILTCLLSAGCVQQPSTTTLSQATETSLAPQQLTGEELIEKLFQDGLSCSTEADFTALYNSIPEQQINGLTVSDLKSFISLFKTKMQRLSKNVTCEAVLTDRETLEFSDANTEARPNGNLQWLADILIDPTSDQDFYRVKFIAQGDLLNPIIYIFFLDKQASVPVLPVKFIRGLISLPQQVKQLESIFKSWDAALLEPFTRVGLISDPSVALRKAQQEIDIYNQTIETAGENQLTVDANQVLSETDKVPGQATLIWHGDIDLTQELIMPKMYRAYIARDGQLKIRLPYHESSYLPAKEIASNDQILALGAEYDQASIVKLFGKSLPYKRAEPETFFFTNTPMQTHYFGQNAISLVGDRSQDQQDYVGYIRQLDVNEGPISLAGQVALGAKIQDVLAAWPLLEDFYVPAYAGGSFGTDYADVIRLDMEQNFCLKIKDGFLQSIHLETFSD